MTTGYLGSVKMTPMVASYVRVSSCAKSFKQRRKWRKEKKVKRE